jgi:hypothetical protein
MSYVLVACAGFLLGVLWMDLMFDLQVLRHPDAPAPLPEPVLASIAAYYRRVTTDSWPLGALIGLVMVVGVSTAVGQALRGGGAWWQEALGLGLIGVPVTLALARVLPNAVRIGTRRDEGAVQSALARRVCRDHLVCLVCMVAFLALQLLRAGD